MLGVSKFYQRIYAKINYIISMNFIHKRTNKKQFLY
jgi:hypothetical protein